MEAQKVSKKWFQLWELGKFRNLPITEDFTHSSPYGIIEGKQAYLNLVEANKDKFLGHRFDIHDSLYCSDKSCIQYTAIQDDFKLEVTEWHYLKDRLIHKIKAYYNIPGDIREDRKLENL
ncbi:nuclear transport factor 2 family protein [Echinicola salinicaeni]|uniref:nuclear transport factor 2 family protein n=1 Tax=Echinicola salinicaeni TaxID=2762757 RepID=UPI001645ACAD|nr:nuclear transport factor 2 family protein [Echinicola salinicaeni]